MSRGPSAAEKMIGDFAPKLVELTDLVLFSDVWERQDLSKHDRSLITVAALIALNHQEQLRFHLDKALDNGLKKEESIEVRSHCIFLPEPLLPAVDVQLLATVRNKLPKWVPGQFP